MTALLIAYIISLIICVICAKFHKDAAIAIIGFFPIINAIVGLIILFEFFFDWIEE